MLHYNIQGISNKNDMLSLYLSDKKFDILCFTEHWLKINDLNHLLIHDYNLISSFCRTANIRGGVAIYAANGEDSNPFDVEEYCVPFHAEFAAATYPRCQALIIGVYRSSSSGNFNIFLQQLERLLDSVFHMHKYLFLMGDINCDLTECNADGVSLRELLATYGLFHTINAYTRITRDSASRLDNIITNFSLDFCSSGVLEPGFSDHNAQYIRLDCENNTKEAERVSRTLMTSLGLAQLKGTLATVNWDDFCLQTISCESAMQMFINILQYFVNEYSVTKILEKNSRTHIQWFSSELLRLRDALSAIKTVCSVTGCRRDWEIYNKFRADYKKKICIAKRNACSNFILHSENKSKCCWGLINSQRRKRSNTKENTKIKPDDFNTYFTSTPRNIIDSLPKHTCDIQVLITKIPNCNSTFFLRPVTEAEIILAITKIKNTHSLDCYGLGSKILKYVGDVIKYPLTVIFNKCLTEGIFPDCLKISRITPIYKKGSVNELNNYRPIAITPILSKVFEIILSIRLTDFLDKHKLLSPRQFGFRSGGSTSHAVRSLLGDVVDGLDREQHTSVVLCDLTKAFDCVSPQILTDKLERYGIRGHALKIFNNYLMHRKQYVEVGGERSLLGEQLYGVPQGSVLGPLLFNIYVNDLPLFLEGEKCILFADDTTLYASGRDIHALRASVDSLLTQTKKWFELNNLKLNDEKTQKLTITSNKLLPPQEHVTLLGINLDSHLTWGSQVDRVCSRVASNLYVIRKLGEIVPVHVVRVAYRALIESHLTYGLTLWGRSAEWRRAFIMQKRAIRAMAGVRSREHCAEWFKRFELLTLPSLYIYASLVELHKISSSISTHSDVHCHGTRNMSHMIIPRSRLRMSQVNKLDVRLFNRLPAHYKNLNLRTFKLRLKAALVKECYYTVEQYLRTGLSPVNEL